MLYYRTLYHVHYIMPAAARVGGRLRNSKLDEIVSTKSYIINIFIYIYISYDILYCEKL